MKKQKTKYERYRDYLDYYGIKSHELTFSDWASMVQAENFFATR